MGTVAITNREQSFTNDKRVCECDVAFSDSYATGGDTVDIADLGLIGVDEILLPSHNVITRKVVSTVSTRHGNSIELAGTTKVPLLKLYTSANTEASAASDNEAVVVRVRFLGQ